MTSKMDMEILDLLDDEVDIKIEILANIESENMTKR